VFHGQPDLDGPVVLVCVREPCPFCGRVNRPEDCNRSAALGHPHSLVRACPCACAPHAYWGAEKILGTLRASEWVKLILRSRLILRDTRRLDVCGTRLGSTDQALIMSLSSEGGMKIKIKKKIKITHACRQRQIVGLVLILDPHLRQST
jgi:hypothetical protein